MHHDTKTDHNTLTVTFDVTNEYSNIPLELEKVAIYVLIKNRNITSMF